LRPGEHGMVLMDPRLVPVLRSHHFWTETRLWGRMAGAEDFGPAHVLDEEKKSLAWESTTSVIFSARARWELR